MADKMKKLEIKKADLTNEEHCNAILNLTDAYARDPMGMNKPLPDEVKNSLIEKLRAFPCNVHFIAYMDGRPAGLANCVFWVLNILRCKGPQRARPGRKSGIQG